MAVELEPMEGAYKLTVVAQDRPSLFASFAGAISSFGLNIVKAEAFSNSQGVILDTFTFTDPKRTFELNPPEAERLQDLMGRIALGKTDARRLFRNRPSPRPERRLIEPQIQFDSEAHETATLVEIVAEDRIGLLYSLATAFSSNACNIDTVLIDTKGHRAIDVFYVAKDGRKLSARNAGDAEAAVALGLHGGLRRGRRPSLGVPDRQNDQAENDDRNQRHRHVEENPLQPGRPAYLPIPQF